MAAQVYIDGIDVLATYGAYPLDYGGLLAWPSLKEVKVIDWPDEDGVEVELSHPVVQSYTVGLPMAIRGDLEAFLSFVYAKPTREYIFPEIGLTRHLRLVGCGDIDTIRSLGTATLTLSVDQPGAYSDTPYTELAIPAGRLFIDDLDVAAYGCTPLDGTSAALRAYANTKEALCVDVSDVSGVLYDNEAAVRIKNRQFTLPFLIRAKDTEEFWRNYMALFGHLTQSGKRVISDGDVLVECYYSGMAVDVFSPPRYVGDVVWHKFQVTMSTTAPAYLLISEKGENVIISEDEQYKILV